MKLFRTRQILSTAAALLSLSILLTGCGTNDTSSENMDPSEGSDTVAMDVEKDSIVEKETDSDAVTFNI